MSKRRQNHNKRWTKADEQYLLAHRHTDGYGEVSRVLKRTRPGCMAKYSFLTLKAQRESNAVATSHDAAAAVPQTSRTVSGNVSIEIVRSANSTKIIVTV